MAAIQQTGGITGARPYSKELFVADIPLGEDGHPRIRKLLIANRGEIACRIIATCKKVNVASVAVYTQEDAISRHVQDADESVCIGSMEKSTRNPFLDIDLLVKTAKDIQADAIHPGYGYLSENANFADSVRHAGLIFVGPPAKAMSTLGDKRSSKDYLRQNAPDVPLIPGFTGTSLEAEDLQRAAVDIGFPVMLKASAGGGGKGMRVVHEPSQLMTELSRAQSEAQRSFGSGDCILEKFIENSKHIEIQVVGDQYGQVVSFFERDCSIQRRNQKVIEETPCPFLDDDTRQRMSETAVRIVKLIGYEGAGTVEFVFDTSTRKFYFLEVNTRLQVEHPITEEVVGVDLVALQLFVAAKGRLSELPQLSNLTQTGHAIECRLCAEDPQRDFLPSHDKILLWKPASPGRSPGSVIRYETAIQSGTSVSIYFDSMICKIVVWAPTRPAAINILARELANTPCIGVRTNQLFLQSCLLHPAFQDFGYKTSFIPNNIDDLLRSPYTPALPAHISLVPSIFLQHLQKSEAQGSGGRRHFRTVRRQFHNQKFDPFHQSCEIISLRDSKSASGGITRCEACLPKPSSSNADNEWDVCLYPVTHNSLNEKDSSSKEGEELPPASNLTATYTATSRAIRTGEAWSGPVFNIKNVELKPLSGEQLLVSKASSLSSPSLISMSVNGQQIRAYLVIPNAGEGRQSLPLNETVRVFCHLPQLGEWKEFRKDTLLSFYTNLRKEALASSDQQSEVKAPMPCKVLSIAKSVGGEVNKGECVMVIESMKMEINIIVGVSGIFHTKWRIGDAVDEGVVLCSVE
ncbi:carbamoyl-phosphate synthase subunit L [Colletotrichum simmondsii]|uniref:Carbamoyl-phosphate synthase subunit L n=1 Tax=Colletotrichum simmondsii TaxID=703756 RepID=A0A135TWZ2_9PEZI|nr:carbamoyl-phosphate synthase subunit L [Colletotrichum simmondsii]